MTTSTRLARTSPLAVLALTAALVATAGAGGAVAGSLVTSKQIKNNTIVSKDVRTGGLNGTDLADGSVGGGDIADASLGSADIADGSLAAGDLGTGARQELRGLLASGVVDGAGVLRVVRSAPGVGVSVTKYGTGATCLRLTGVAANAATTGLVVSANYSYDTTSTSSSTVAEGKVPGPGCTDGFPVVTLLESGSSLALSDQGFSFMIG